MAFPKIASIDGAAVENALKTSVRKGFGEVAIGGTVAPVTNTSAPYAAFDQLQEFVVSTRKVRDAAAATHEGVFGNDGVKEHLDRVDAREAAHYAELKAAIEAAGWPPFPG